MGIIGIRVFFFLSYFFLNRVLLSVEVSSVTFFPVGGGISIGTVEIRCTRVGVSVFFRVL